ncbi:MAG: mevalonate kinase [Candidatus Thorarchaeota archaeon]
MRIIASAPGKLILFGEHASSRGRPAIVFAINKRVTVTISKCNQHKILLTSNQYNVFQEEYPSMKLDMVSNLIATFFRKFEISEKPLEIVIESDLKSGFGSSAALIVALFGALFTYFDIMPSKIEFLRICIEYNREFKGYGSGLDIASALYGGMIKYQTDRTPEALPFEKLKILIGNTKYKASSGPIVQQVRDFEVKNPIESRRIFDRIAEIVSEAEDAIIENDQRKLGNLMTENHRLLQQIGVSSETLDKMIDASIRAGAYGAKLSGAGIGDNMLALVTTETLEAVINALNTSPGVAEADIIIDSKGLDIKKEL